MEAPACLRKPANSLEFIGCRGLSRSDRNYGFSTVELEGVDDGKHGEEVVGGRSGMSKDKTALALDRFVEIEHDFAINKVTKAIPPLA
ncbi:MAG: hypothetical protein UV32_C0018G0004 [Candidatus Collierbacteria bacterium GW2011_GWF2_42_51]|nr:MAG: hypothetical protein UV32_C0018G0004 [Candidatus Collierbacteria bacterium GW2011_GWF2_42_51]